MAQKIKIKYDEKYIENFKKILAAATCVDSPFVKTTQYIDEQFDSYNIDDEVRARTISGLLADLSINFTQNAMQNAMELAQKELTFDQELRALELRNQGLEKELEALELKNKYAKEKHPLEMAQLRAQNDLTTAQIEKIKAEQKLAEEQQKAIERQVKDNRVIKATSILGDFLQNLAQRDLIPPASMNEHFFNLLAAITKGDGIAAKAIADYEIKKGK